MAIAQWWPGNILYTTWANDPIVWIAPPGYKEKDAGTVDARRNLWINGTELSNPEGVGDNGGGLGPAKGKDQGHPG